MLAQIRAAQGSYALSPLFVEPQHIKMKPKMGRASLLLLVLGQSALAERGGRVEPRLCHHRENWLTPT